jgi:hypothetical protein
MARPPIQIEKIKNGKRVKTDQPTQEPPRMGRFPGRVFKPHAHTASRHAARWGRKQYQQGIPATQFHVATILPKSQVGNKVVKKHAFLRFGAIDTLTEPGIILALWRVPALGLTYGSSRPV